MNREELYRQARSLREKAREFRQFAKELELQALSFEVQADCMREGVQGVFIEEERAEW